MYNAEFTCEGILLCHGVGDWLNEVAVEICGPAAVAGFSTVTFQLLKHLLANISTYLTGKKGVYIYTYFRSSTSRTRFLNPEFVNRQLRSKNQHQDNRD
jgi:hypothetical protein